MNEARGELQLLQNVYDLEWLTASTERNCKLIPIKIPLYRGILGFRLLLVRKADHEKISNITNISDLRQLTGGHGLHWQDLSIYAANELPVHANVKYETLFEQLKTKRFDYFHRGINEVWEEYEQHKDSLSIADNILLFYEQPVYYYVSPHRPLLAKDLTLGLQRALEDGSYKALFSRYFDHILKRVDFENRKIIKLKSVSSDELEPKLETDWWMPRTLLPKE